MIDSSINSYPYWNNKTKDILDKFGTGLNGLNQSESEERQEIFGKNVLITARERTALRIFIDQFKNPIMLILIIASVISAIVKDLSDSIIIFLIILGSSVLSSIQEFNANNAANELKKRISITSSVLRDKKVIQIESSDLVPGDIVLLSAGSLVPADCLILESNDLFVNESVLTGETFPVEKSIEMVKIDAPLSERMNCVFMGTNVRSGSAKVLVARTGKNTEFGKISKSLALKPPETEFERGVREFGLLLSEIMLIMVILVFGLNIYFKKPFIDSLLFSIALGVGITPQLLPAIVSITLSTGAQRMAKKGVIVKKLNAIENFGSMDTLCTDKTGTLTEGEVKLNGQYSFDGQLSDYVQNLAFLNAHFQNGLANPIDEAILADKKYDVTKITKISEIPYDFIRKRLTVILEINGESVMITKGALKNILEVSSEIEIDGHIRPITKQDLTKITSQFKSWSGKGNRVLGVAKKLIEDTSLINRDQEIEMVFVGFLVFYDPPKEDAAKTIKNLGNLGIDLKIITGDNENVSKYIAKTVGLEKIHIITGAQLNRMSDEALWHKVEETNLFAEVDPNQKERIISALQRNKHVVGYLGDGINDAPSLHNADVGISVDQAVDVAKEAADFVLMDHDLEILEQGVLLGRSAFANTMKYVNVTTSANFGNMFSMAGISILLPFLPLLPMQVLLTNFLTDFPAMMIAGDFVDEEFIQKPHRWKITEIRKFMLNFGILSSIFDYLTFGLLLFGLKMTETNFQTGWFIESVLTELIALVILRTRMPFYRSRIGKGLGWLTLTIFILTLFLPYIPWLNIKLGFDPIPVYFMLLIVLLTFIYAMANEFIKRRFYPTNKQ